MRTKYISIFLIFLFLFVNCTNSVDITTETELLLQTDREFAEASIQMGTAEAFNEYLADDAVMLTASGDPVKGRDSIYELMSSGPEFSIQWTPVKAEVSTAGDLGYTWGIYRMQQKNADGSVSNFNGKYLNIWKKQSSGDWKVIVDIGSQSPAE